jgi:hypothetical protein
MTEPSAESLERAAALARECPHGAESLREIKPCCKCVARAIDEAVAAERKRAAGGVVLALRTLIDHLQDSIAVPCLGFCSTVKESLGALRQWEEANA